jgi:hypothetical protein
MFAKTAVDYCFGLGHGPLAAARLGYRFCGSELSPGRMAMTLRKMAALTGVPARRV